jgi:hypothetical protein
MVDNTDHGNLAFTVASRLTSAWDAELTVAAMIPPDADEEERLRVEGDLDAFLGVSIRARVRAIPAPTPVEGLMEESEANDLIVVGISTLKVEGMEAAAASLKPLVGSSIVLVRAHPEASLEARRNP